MVLSTSPPKELLLCIEDVVQSSVRDLTPVSGGCISQALVVGFASAETCFLKWNFESPDGFFEAEALGLKTLGEAGEIKVPGVLACRDGLRGGVPSYILLEALVPGKQDKKAEAELGRGLAALHRHSRESFGFEEDNFIGRLEQRNEDADCWGEFFLEQRLAVQAELGGQAGWFNWECEEMLKEAAPAIVEMLNEPGEPPALLHGDLWSGNVFWSSEGPALIDPAVYYGNREADLAFTEMFGGFGREFYHAYQESFPLLDGFERRKKVLNLYHLMTHSNLFGGSYIGGVKRMLRDILQGR